MLHHQSSPLPKQNKNQKRGYKMNKKLYLGKKRVLFEYHSIGSPGAYKGNVHVFCISCNYKHALGHLEFHNFPYTDVEFYVYKSYILTLSALTYFFSS